MSKEIRYAPLREYFEIFDPFLRHLKTLPYWDRRVFLRKKTSREHPRFEYKYRRLPKIPSDPQFDFLADIIVESRLYLSSPDSFNDPFDMTALVTIQGSRKSIREKFDRIAKQQPGMTHKKRRVEVDLIMTRTTDEILESVKKGAAKVRSNTGIFSLSANPRSLLMWGHYGGEHSGICLQFEIAKGPDPFLETMKVDYVPDYPVNNWLSDEKEQLINNTMTHKFEDWKYEKEWRLVQLDSADCYRSFPPECLTGVIIGCRADSDQLEMLKLLLQKRRERGHPDLRVYEARKHPTRYALKIYKYEQNLSNSRRKDS